MTDVEIDTLVDAVAESIWRENRDMMVFAAGLFAKTTVERLRAGGISDKVIRQTLVVST